MTNFKASLALIASLFVATSHAGSDGKCYALALSSADETAAWQAGVLSGLISQNGASSHDYDALSGVSGGGLNAAIYSAYASGAEEDAAARLVQFWQDASNSPLYKDWLGGIVEGALLKGGIYNSEPLAEFLASELSDITTMERWANVGLTDIETGMYSENTPSTLESNLQDVLFASFAFAGYFPPAQSMGTAYFDGSVVWDVDIFSAVNKCLETYEASDVVLDVIMTSRATLATVDASRYTAIQVFHRYLEVSSYYSTMDGLLRAEFAYPDIEWRYVISPSEDLPTNRVPLNLNSTQIDDMITLGQSDAQSAQPGSDGIEDLMDYFGLKKKNDGRVSGVSFEEFTEKKQLGEFSDFNRREDLHLKRKYAF